MKPKQRTIRFYDVMSQYVPQFARVRSMTATLRPRTKGARRGALLSLTHKAPIDPIVSEDDTKQEESWRPNVHLRTDPIRVKPLPAMQKHEPLHLDIDFRFESEADDDGSVSVMSVVPSTTSFDRVSALASSRSSRSTSSRSSLDSDTPSSPSSPMFTARDLEEAPEPMFTMDQDDDDDFKMPEIPPLAVDLTRLLASLPDSAPASLSPFTFCEEVVGLQGQDFVQFLEEDTLCLKSVLYGDRFNEDTIYDFFISLTEDQYSSAFEAVFRQYFKLATLSNLVREFFLSETVPELALKIEKACEKLFGVRTAMVWINIASAKTLVNHSRLMKYPHGTGLVGTAASEKRQVVAPNPTLSPLYCEEYDFPFCEEAEMILVEPIIHPKTNELCAVIMMIDKVHPNGASYMYWPQSELTLLQFFSSNLYRVFDKFDRDIRATAKLYKVIAKYMSYQLDFFKLLGTVKNTIADLVKCESVSIYFKEGKSVFWFETSGNKVQRVSCTVIKAGIAGYVFDHNVFVHCACACDHPAFNSKMDGRYKSRSALAVPLTSGQDVFCVIVCRSKKLLPCFLSEDVHNLSFIAAGASPALQMAMSYRKKLSELKVALRAQDRLAALLQTAESLSRETNIDTLVSTILMNACQLIGADRASLFVIDESRTHLISKVAHGTTKPLLLPIDQGIAGHVATTGETINIPDVYEDPRFNSNVDKATGYRTKSLMTIPVHDQQGNIIAVAQLMNKLNGEPFTDSDVELTKAMSVFTGIALANSVVIEGSILSTQRVHALLETSFLLMSGESLSSVLHHIMSVSRDLVQADRCALFMISADKEKIKSTVLAGEENQIIVKRGKGVVGYVAQHNKLVNIPDAYKDKRFHSGVDQATGYRTRSILAAPVIDNRSKVIGVVEMINKDQLYNGGTFTKEDEKLTTAFATFAGIAFDKKSQHKASGDGQTLAILLSNMMTAEESNSFSPPHQIMLSQEKLKEVQTNRFDVEQLKTLDGFRLVISFFFDLGFSHDFKINNAKLIRFLLAVHDLHCDANYHSWNRAIESAQFVYYLLTTTDLPMILSKLEAFALFIAAICHDLHHYNIEDKSRSEIALAVLYRNRPVLEMHHCEQCINVISKPEHNIFENIEQDQQVQLWQSIISLILSTDMAQHFQLVQKFRSLVFPTMMLNMNSPQHKLLLSQIVLKCCDAATACRLFPVNERWAKTLNDLGHKLNASEAGTNEEEMVIIAKNQVGFSLIVAQPLFTVLVQAIPEAKPALDQLIGNLDEWKARAAGK